MTVATENSYLKGAKGRNTRGLLRLVILCTIAAAAVSSRLFSVISMYMCAAPDTHVLAREIYILQLLKQGISYNIVFIAVKLLLTFFSLRIRKHNPRMCVTSQF